MYTMVFRMFHNPKLYKASYHCMLLIILKVLCRLLNSDTSDPGNNYITRLLLSTHIQPVLKKIVIVLPKKAGNLWFYSDTSSRKSVESFTGWKTLETNSYVPEMPSLSRRIFKDWQMFLFSLSKYICASTQ